MELTDALKVILDALDDFEQSATDPESWAYGRGDMATQIYDAVDQFYSAIILRKLT